MDRTHMSQTCPLRILACTSPKYDDTGPAKEGVWMAEPSTLQCPIVECRGEGSCGMAGAPQPRAIGLRSGIGLAHPSLRAKGC